MPWEHCGLELSDNENCPCGMSKTEWTIHGDQTRAFTVNTATVKKKVKDSWVTLRVVDAQGEGVPGVTFKVNDASSRKHLGETGDDGRIKISNLPAGPCRVAFPGHMIGGEEGSRTLTPAEIDTSVPCGVLAEHVFELQAEEQPTGDPQVVRLDPQEGRKQFINLPGEGAELGRTVRIAAYVEPARAGVVVYFGVRCASKGVVNLERGDTIQLAEENLAVLAAGSSTGRLVQAETDAQGQASVELRVSTYAGDVSVVGASCDQAAANAFATGQDPEGELAQSGELETWRRVFLEVDYMQRELDYDGSYELLTEKPLEITREELQRQFVEVVDEPRQGNPPHQMMVKVTGDLSRLSDEARTSDAISKLMTGSKPNPTSRPYVQLLFLNHLADEKSASRARATGSSESPAKKTIEYPVTGLKLRRKLRANLLFDLAEDRWLTGQELRADGEVVLKTKAATCHTVGRHTVEMTFNGDYRVRNVPLSHWPEFSPAEDCFERLVVRRQGEVLFETEHNAGFEEIQRTVTFELGPEKPRGRESLGATDELLFADWSDDCSWFERMELSVAGGETSTSEATSGEEIFLERADGQWWLNADLERAVRASGDPDAELPQVELTVTVRGVRILPGRTGATAKIEPRYDVDNVVVDLMGLASVVGEEELNTFTTLRGSKAEEGPGPNGITTQLRREEGQWILESDLSGLSERLQGAKEITLSIDLKIYREVAGVSLGGTPLMAIPLKELENAYYGTVLETLDSDGPSGAEQVQNELTQTILHEIGHCMGLASPVLPDGDGFKDLFDGDGPEKGTRDAPIHQTAGVHCKAQGGTCLMYYQRAPDVNRTTFCAYCAAALRARNLSRVPVEREDPKEVVAQGSQHYRFEA